MAEYSFLNLVTQCRKRLPNPAFDLPKPLGAVQLGRHTYTIESAVLGRALSRWILTSPRDQRLGWIQKELPRCVDVAVQISRLLQGERAIPAVPESWWQLPPEVNSNSELRQISVEAGFSAEAAKSYADFVQHGDFTIENIFLTSAGAELTIIDWEHLRRGLPPLYDVYTLLVSALPLFTDREQSTSPAETPWAANLQTAFFGNGSPAQLYREMIMRALRGFGVGPEEAWRQFVHFLLLVLHRLRSRKSPFAQELFKLIVLAAKFKSSFLSGTR
jgi:hypothetical protein